MFETSVVRAHAQAAGGRFSLLTISLIAHSAVIVGAVAMSIASVDFPTTAPDEIARAPIFARVHIPPPLGTPDGGGAKPKPPQQPQQKPAVVLPTQPVAPTQIPDAVPTVEPSAVTQQAATPGIPGNGEGSNEGPLGDPNGDPNSIADPNSLPIVTETAPTGRIYEAHEVKAPVLLQRVEPNYPNAFRAARLKVTVVVRCIIDKNGQVRDTEILKPGPPAFNAEVTEAVQRWRFTPGSLNGVAVDTYLNLTVNFSIK